MVKGYSITNLMQEVYCTAQNSNDSATIRFLTEGVDMHCEFVRYMYEELKDASDAEIKANHADKRQELKGSRFAFTFGGSYFTVHMHTGKPLEECKLLESTFKTLHAGLYERGEANLAKALVNGYIHIASGFRFYLPFFDEFLEVQAKVEDLSDKEKQLYNTVYSHIKEECQLSFEEYDKDVFNVGLSEIPTRDYLQFKSIQKFKRKYNKLKSSYFRICLNYENQGLAAHITKRALAILFIRIVENGDLFKARIAGFVHD